MAAGVYSIRCIATGQIYVGSSIDIERRWKTHRRELRSGAHRNPKMQSAWRRHGEDSFVFDVIDLVAPENLLAREAELIAAHRAADKRLGFNILMSSYSRLGTPHKPETRAKISAAKMGNKSRLGLRHTAATKTKMSATLKGRIISDDHRQKLSIAGTGKVLSLETRQKLSAAKAGKPKPPGFGLQSSRSQSLFDADTVRLIRTRYLNGQSMRSIARLFETSHVVIGKVVHGKGTFYSSI